MNEFLTTLLQAVLVAGYCIYKGYAGSLPWLSAMLIVFTLKSSNSRNICDFQPIPSILTNISCGTLGAFSDRRSITFSQDLHKRRFTSHSPSKKSYRKL